MKKLILLLMLFSTSAFAKTVTSEEYCTNLTVRYTMFHMVAMDANNESQYKQGMYNALLSNHLDKDSNDLIKGLVDIAWLNYIHKKDVLDSAMEIYHVCIGGKSA